MTEAQAKRLFEKYNPAEGVVRCPHGRAKMRKPLDIYAKAAVNLYGIIRRDRFVEIFNAQNEEQTTADEVYTILLPNVLKFGWYGFYKEYIVHYAVLRDFDWVDYLVREQSDKPRYVPPREQFTPFEWEKYEGNSHWQNVRKFMWEAFGYSKHITEGFAEIKSHFTHSLGLKELGAIMDKHNLVFDGEEQAQKFFDLLMLAKNNTRIWENKGYTPNELSKLLAKQQPEGPVIHRPKKIGPNMPCPCGSGKKYKNCCKPIEDSGSAQLSHSERRLFYETWYKLLDFVNRKLHVIDYTFSMVYQEYHDETLLFKIRERLWENPGLIGEFAHSNAKLSGEEAGLLQAWKNHHIQGRFILMKYTPDSAILMRMDDHEAPLLYAVKGITDSIAEAMHRRLPVMLETVLLPFHDRIIYDSFMASHAIDFGDGIREAFEDAYNQSNDENGIIAKLKMS